MWAPFWAHRGLGRKQQILRLSEHDGQNEGKLERNWHQPEAMPRFGKECRTNPETTEGSYRKSRSRLSMRLLRYQIVGRGRELIASGASQCGLTH